MRNSFKDIIWTKLSCYLQFGSASTTAVQSSASAGGSNAATVTAAHHADTAGRPHGNPVQRTFILPAAAGSLRATVTRSVAVCARVCPPAASIGSRTNAPAGHLTFYVPGVLQSSNRVQVQRLQELCCALIFCTGLSNCSTRRNYETIDGTRRIRPPAVADSCRIFAYYRTPFCACSWREKAMSVVKRPDAPNWRISAC